MVKRNTGARNSVIVGLLAALAGALGPARLGAQAPPTLARHIQQITARREFRHATFGIEFYDLDAGRAVYALNPEELFTPASTTKLLTEGAALELLGPNYRFPTRVYRTGPVAPDGTLEGDLVLVASGDPNLSGRIQPDGTLAFENEDHCYGGSVHTRAVPGDPLLVIHELARQVAARGVRRIAGRLVVDTSLFPEGTPELGTDTIISPIIVNDNIVDVTASPGAAVGAPVNLEASPATSYAHFRNQAVTGAPDSKPDIRWEKDTANPDGSRTVSVTGSMPLGKPSVLFTYAVPQPSRFAAVAFTEALRAAGVLVALPPPTAGLGAGALVAERTSYVPQNLVAEHVSPPLSEEVKVTLKVSQNLHASVTPYILGAVLAHRSDGAEQAGFDLEHNWLAGAGLDLSGASQADGAGGSEAAFFTPDFIVHYLAYLWKQKDFPIFFKALPILGTDGTLWDIQVHSPAAGHVFAKTGTYTAYNALNRDVIVTGKGLAGYFTTPIGRHFAFAVYANRVAVPRDDEEVTKIVGQALGEIAAAGYLELAKF